MDTAAAASTVNNDVVDFLILAGYFLNNSRDGDWLVVCLLGSSFLGDSDQIYTLVEMPKGWCECVTNAMNEGVRTSTCRCSSLVTAVS